MPEQQMKNFIIELFEMYFPDCGDIDGAELQELAEKHGILVPEIRHKPCGEFCNCSEICSEEEFEKGVECYRLASFLCPHCKNGIIYDGLYDKWFECSYCRKKE